MKRTVMFVDADRNKVTAECEITNRNGYPGFTMSGEYAGLMGQCFDSVKPANEYQAKLIQIWREWHLNGMNAGTDNQMVLVKGMGYDQARETLASIDRRTGTESFLNYQAIEKDIQLWEQEIKDLKNWYEKGTDRIMAETHHAIRGGEFSLDDYYTRTLNEYTKQLNTDIESLKTTMLYDTDPRDPTKLYKYGSEWLRKDLPEDFEDNLNELLDNIDEIEEQNSDRLIEDTEEDAELFQDFSNPITAHGLALICGLSVNEVEDIVENSDTYWTVQGVDYIAGTDDEMDDAWDVELDNYLEECVYPDLPENMRIYFDDDKWKDDARVDGRGHSLNRYDGGEEYTQVQREEIYAYRQ